MTSTRILILTAIRIRLVTRSRTNTTILELFMMDLKLIITFDIFNGRQGRKIFRTMVRNRRINQAINETHPGERTLFRVDHRHITFQNFRIAISGINRFGWHGAVIA